MVCFKYVVTNGCGHIRVTVYTHCGGEHDDNENANRSCYRSAPEEDRNRAVSVCMGTEFCNRGCRGLYMGWICCTCGFRHVDGFYHPTLRMVVHLTGNGMIHGFCSGCRDVIADDHHTAFTRPKSPPATPPYGPSSPPRTPERHLAHDSNSTTGETGDLCSSPTVAAALPDQSSSSATGTKPLSAVDGDEPMTVEHMMAFSNTFKDTEMDTHPKTVREKEANKKLSVRLIKMLSALVQHTDPRVRS